MPRHNNSSTYIVAVAKRAAANSALERLGWPGPNNFNVPIMDGLGVAVTHYSCHVDLTDDQKTAWEATLSDLGIRSSSYPKKTIRQYADEAGKRIGRFNRHTGKIEKSVDIFPFSR